MILLFFLNKYHLLTVKRGGEKMHKGIPFPFHGPWASPEQTTEVGPSCLEQSLTSTPQHLLQTSRRRLLRFPVLQPERLALTWDLST